MYEALKNTDGEQILFMDDDIRIEPDSILRALAFSRFSKVPTLVGGQMLNLQEPSHLHVMGEMIDARTSCGPVGSTPNTTTTSPSTRSTVGEYRSRLLTVASTSTSTAGGCA